ncbi:unnamed protein product [Tilletia controversa]|uniref:Dolichyl-diphosphooligosaccharide-protein glycosyltransferase subunit OST5 n=3 Tax=Tilletia TaxID=13289 RepID=A0A8X7MTC0_9BASI|nr:hypothetical protein CF336_g3377 [Tilletia laevis]KAE8199868.1 hypothetical protein CF328_g3126 [Tilletia controversa]KAE8262064.1 hypothetical protein A4X03_0g2750 [Tilletia caries]KAE8204501.1 hypothetical protein CF335_g2637 [Tilletia laevis]KAE8248258.1 hypothetical protein A4X06_0g3839 [Tilletia controversa]
MSKHTLNSYDHSFVLHQISQPFKAAIPLSSLPYIAFALLGLTFGLTFVYTTLPKQRYTAIEFLTAVAASLSAGFGTVALFNSVGVQC